MPTAIFLEDLFYPWLAVWDENIVTLFVVIQICSYDMRQKKRKKLVVLPFKVKL